MRHGDGKEEAEEDEGAQSRHRAKTPEADKGEPYTHQTGVSSPLQITETPE